MILLPFVVNKRLSIDKIQAVARIVDRILPHMKTVVKLYLQLFSIYCALRVLGLRVWPFGSRDVIGHVTIRSPYAISYWCFFETGSLYPAIFEIGYWALENVLGSRVW